jgi:hypothetical protein
MAPHVFQYGLANPDGPRFGDAITTDCALACAARKIGSLLPVRSVMPYYKASRATIFC